MNSEHLEAYLAGELDDNGRRQVEYALERDEDLRASYLQQVRMDSALRVLLGEEAEQDRQSFQRGVMARLRSEGAGDSRSFAKSVLTEIVEEREGVRPIHWPDLIKAGLVAAAASVALMFFLQNIVFNQSTVGRTVSESNAAPVSTTQFLARLEGSENLKWAPGTASIVRGDGWLSSGVLEIESGFAMIAFNSGATVVVDGPAEISIESSNRAFLKAGRLTANVPPAAAGFTINTPRLNAVDLGTRFGISVEPNGDSELHVMEGEVEASRSSGNAVATIVREGLSLRADSRTRTELAPIPYAGDTFTMTIGPLGIADPLLRYRFDESGGAMIEDSGSLRQFDVPIVGSGELGASPRRSVGVQGGALVFQPGETLDVPLSHDFRLDGPHTISFWVKIPPRLGKTSEETVVRYGREGSGWLIACNFDSLAGAKGALRIECGDSYAIGATDIADGNWHHVAYRFLGGEEASLATHLHLFVDGLPERISEVLPGKLDQGRAGNLRFGGDSQTGLQGWIDEFAIFREAISTPAIQDLHR